MSREEIAERYLLGKLSDDEREAFELHLLECDHCGLEVDTLRALQAELAASPAPGRRPLAGPVGWLLLAAALLVAGTLTLWPERASSPAPASTDPSVRLADLARIEPPAYEAIVLRGGDADAVVRFREGMEAYARGDWSAAIGPLESALAHAPDAPHVLFYLGVTYHLAGDAERAAERLDRLARLPESAFTEEGAFYRAKALLATGRVEAARAALREMASTGGAMSEDARALLAALDELE